MAISVSIKVTLPKTKFATKKWLEEIASEQRKSANGKLKHIFERTVYGWSNKPTFGWTQTRNADEMSIMMYPKGPYADIWNLVSSGSPRHSIPARTGGLLRFRPGYRSATVAGSLQSRRAYRSGPYVTAKSVSHPGFDPRDFPELIADEYRATFTDDMQFAINIAARS